MTNEQLNQCPVCNNTDLKSLRTIQDHFGQKEIFNLDNCQQCNTLITNPRPSPDDIIKYYKSDSYVSHGDKTNPVFDTLYASIQKLNFKKKKHILQTYTLEKNHLDYGCGAGAFLNYLNTNNWQVSGIEPDEQARNIATNKHGLHNIFPDLLTLDQQPSKSSYSSISLFHVLEHVHTLKETLEKLISLLNRNGVIILALPNYKSYDAQIYGEYWAGYDVPRHLYHFTQKSIHQLSKTFGLNIVATHPMKFDSFYVSLLSEQYKYGSKRYLHAFLNGYKSNLKASKSNEYSSLIYVLSR